MLHQNIGDSNMAMIYLADGAPLPQRAQMCGRHIWLTPKCRAAPGSHAVPGAAAKEAQHGPLDFALWAYRDGQLALGCVIPCPGYRCPLGRVHATYTLRHPVMGEVLSTRIWGVPPAGGPLL